MREVYKNLYIGKLSDFYSINIVDWAVVHATQTIHYELLGWDRKYNKPPRNHPDYIKLKDENRLSLNWVDGASHLYNWTGVETFIEIMDFIDNCIDSRKVLIHCDQGIYRSPTLGLLYLAKRVGKISNNSYEDANTEFLSIYPEYLPSGIGEYVSEKWNLIR